MADNEQRGSRQNRATRFWLRLLVACMLLVVFTGALLIWHGRPRAETQNMARPALSSEDPRITYAGPWANVRPGVETVGSDKCGRCHAEIAKSFSENPMARTLLPIADLAGSQSYDPAHHNPFVAFGTLFRVEHAGRRVWHRREAAEPGDQLDLEVHYAIGSGSHGYSYLTNRDGYLFQTPISWFSQKRIWDKSPGFAAEAVSGRPIPGQCLFCHSNGALSLDNQVNRYAPPIFPYGHGIGCERCHGPGEMHIANPGHMVPIFDRMPGVVIDPTIVHPRKLKNLDPDLCEAICQQCHLTGEARILRRHRALYGYRPGLPLDAVWSIFVLAHKSEDKWKAVNHVEQMYLSKCFQNTSGAGRLGCISCHDPHLHIGADRRAQFFRQRCLACHRDSAAQKAGAASCSLRLAARELANGNSCIDCHMTRYPAADIAHTASTDHRILRKPDTRRAADGAREDSLAHFHRGSIDPKDKQLSRDLALALVSAAKTSPQFAVEAVPLLEIALANDPEDIDAWEQKGLALSMQNRAREALAAFEAVLAKAPDREMATGFAGTLSYNLGQLDQALKHFRSVRELNPWMPEYRRNLATALFDQHAWAEALGECRAGLRLNPGDIDARKLCVECLLLLGQERQARAEFRHIEAFRPANLDQLQAWFKGKTGPAR